jgi:hypothetical protein
VLFYLFSARMHNSCVKIKRWCTKLIADYPLVDLHFMRTTENLSEGLPHEDFWRFKIKDAQVSDFYDQLNAHAFVENHSKYLTVNRPDHLNIRAQVSAITYGLSNIEEMITPLKIL